MNQIILSPSASKALETFAKKDKQIVLASLEKIKRQEFDTLIKSSRVLKVAKEKDYYSFRASSKIRILFQVENRYEITILDIASLRYIKTRKTFLNLFSISLIVFAILIYIGTAGSKYFIPIVTTNTPTSTITPVVMNQTSVAMLPSFTAYPTVTSTPYPTYTPLIIETVTVIPSSTFAQISTPTLYGTLPPISIYTATATASPTNSPYPTYTAYPTNTPQSTHTKYPTSTPQPTYTAYPTSTPQPTPTSTPVPLISDQVRSIGGWVFGTATSCLMSIVTFIGFLSTTVLTWKKEAREAKHTKLDYQKTMLELEKMKEELKTINKSKVEKQIISKTEDLLD